jgi:hypothetical protein
MSEQDLLNDAMANPVCRFLNEISAAETQKEAADLLAEYREMVRGLPRDRRKYVLEQR